jgi:hypothetical protein
LRKLITVVVVLAALAHVVNAEAHMGPRRVKHLIRQVFPRHYRAAQAVAWCESRYDPMATNGQYKGIYQLSTSWRLYFRRMWHVHDVAYTPAENVRAAHAIYRAQGWDPWQCKP